MKAIKTLLILTTATVSVIPGFLVIRDNLGVPIESLQSLFFGIVESAGCLCLLIVFLKKDDLQKLTNNRKATLSILGFCCFFAFLCLYMILYNSCVVVTPSARAFFPLMVTPELEQSITDVGNRYNFTEQLLTNGAQSVIEETASFSQTVTVIIFLLIFVLALVSLILSFAIITVNQTDNAAPNGKA